MLGDGWGREVVEVLLAEAPEEPRAFLALCDMLVGSLGSEEVEDFGAELGESRVTDTDEVYGATGALCKVLVGDRVRDGAEVLRAEAEGPGAVAAFWNVFEGVVGGFGLEGVEVFGAGLRKGRAGEADEGPLVVGAFCEALGTG